MKGKFVVRACPGSGKTYCVAARLARLIPNWIHSFQGIATLSFTNTAWKQVKRECASVFKTRIDYPHFVGTIDSFINQNIFLPFAYLVLEHNGRPTMVGQPYGAWDYSNYQRDPAQYFDKVSFDITGNLIPIAQPQNFHFRWKNKDGSNNGNVPKIREAKMHLLKIGFANQADSNYFSMKILEEHPIIAKNIAERFPYLIVDEAQDTTDIQMRIIDLLIENGLQEVMMVGDPDQAIFEWNDAKPQLITDKYDEWIESITLNENRRSSNAICAFTYKISGLKEKSIAVNHEVRNLTEHPIIYNYSEFGIDDLVKFFLRKCEKIGIDITPENVAVLTRGSDIHYQIAKIDPPNFNRKPWLAGCNLAKECALARYLFDQDNFSRSFDIFEKVIVKFKLNKKQCNIAEIHSLRDEYGYSKFMTEVEKLIKEFPTTANKSIGQWISESNEILKEQEIHLEINPDAKLLTFPQVFLSDTLQDSLPYRLGTVHSVKGETFEATLLILKQKGKSKFYKTLISKGCKTIDDEELRVAYVGMTRPRKLLMLGVPDAENVRAWESLLDLNT